MGYRIVSGLWTTFLLLVPYCFYRQGHEWAGYLLVVMVGLMLGILAERQGQHEKEGLT
jgi:Trk-type K+ transport system membrane component